MLGTRRRSSSVVRGAARRSAGCGRWRRTLRGVKPPRYPTLWEACAHAVVFQQISIHAGAAIMRRLVEALAEEVSRGEVCGRVFPGPERWLAAREAVLLRRGLSRNKAAHLRSIATAFGGRHDAAKSHLDTLTDAGSGGAAARVRGIGPWSAAVVPCCAVWAARRLSAARFRRRAQRGARRRRRRSRRRAGNARTDARHALLSPAARAACIRAPSATGAARHAVERRHEDSNRRSHPSSRSSVRSERAYLRSRLAADVPLVQLRRVPRSAATSTGARCASSTTTSLRAAKGFRRIRIATWRSSRTSSTANSRIATAWAITASSGRGGVQFMSAGTGVTHSEFNNLADRSRCTSCRCGCCRANSAACRRTAKWISRRSTGAIAGCES